MKWWAITILLLVLTCLTIPFVTADEKEGGQPPLNEKPKLKTPAVIDYKRDALAPVKRIVGLKVDPVEITIDGKWAATIPENSPLFNVPTTKECLNKWPYGTIQWVSCELE